MTALIELRLKGQKAVSAGLKQTARDEEGIGKSAKRAAAGVLLLGGAGIAAAKGLYEIGASFDDAYDTIRVQTGKTGAALNGLEDSFRAVVKTVPADFATASQAVGLLNSRLGLTGKASENRSAQFLELSRITKTDLGENIASVTRLFGDWDVATNQQAGTLDKLFRAGQQSGTSVAALARQVVQFGAPLRQLGFGLDQSVAMFASFEKAGVNVQTLMPGLKFALKSFLSEGRDPGKALIATFKGIRDGTLDTSKAFKIFGGRATPDMIEAIRQGRFDLDKMTASLRGGKDTVMGAAKDTRDLSEAWQIFKNRAMLRLEPIAIRVFEILGGGMTKLPGQIEPAISSVRSLVGWFERHKTVTTALAYAVGTAAAALVLYKAALIATAGWQRVIAAAKFVQYWIALAKAEGIMTTAQFALNLAMSANPIGAIVLGVAALTAGLIYAYRHSEGFRNVLGTVWGAMKTGFSWIKGNWPLLLAILTGPFGLAALAIKRNFGSIVGFLKGVMNGLIDVLNVPIKAINLLPDFLTGGDIGLIAHIGDTKGPADGRSTLVGSGSRRAKGGPVTAGHSYLVNEEGQEIFTAGRNGYIHDAKTSAGMMAGGGGLDEGSIARIVAAVMRNLPDIVVAIDRQPIARASADQFRDDAAYAT